MGAEQSTPSGGPSTLEKAEEANEFDMRIQAQLAERRAKEKLAQDFDVLVQKRMLEMWREKDPEKRKGWPAVKRLFTHMYDSEEDIQRLSWESEIIVKAMMFGGMAGFAFGGYVKSFNATREFIRRYNEFTFEGKLDQRKRILDHQLAMLGKNGITFGFKCWWMSGALATLYMADIAYHDDIRVLDFMVLTGGAFGATRLWLGSKAMLGASIIGMVFGGICGGLLKLSLVVSGDTIDAWRAKSEYDYLNQKTDMLNEARKEIYLLEPAFRDLLNMDEHYKMQSAKMIVEANRAGQQPTTEAQPQTPQQPVIENSQPIHLSSQPVHNDAGPSDSPSVYSRLTSFLPSFLKTAKSDER